MQSAFLAGAWFGDTSGEGATHRGGQVLLHVLLSLRHWGQREEQSVGQSAISQADRLANRRAHI